MQRSRKRAIRPSLHQLEDRNLLSTLVVTNLYDSGPGSLRQDVQAANLLGGPNTIVFSPTLHGQIHLTSGEIPISSTLTISHPAGPLTLAVDAGGLSRIFNVQNPVQPPSVSISGLTLENGVAPTTSGLITNMAGGAIVQVNGSLKLTNDNLVNNSASIGGAVANYYGDLSADVDTFLSNKATNQVGGGAIYNSGDLDATHDTFTNNTAPKGGAVINRDQAGIGGVSADISFSRFIANSATVSGGAIGNTASAVLNLDNDLFVANHATVNGGAVWQDLDSGPSGTPTTTISSSQFFANTAAADGGALAQTAASGSLMLSDSTLEYNSAVTGGAVYARLGTFTPNDNLITSNSAPEVVQF
jgi:predicted outer membrane repeat protein